MSSPVLRSAFVVLLVSPVVSHACATCGCSLSADAAMGYSPMSGWRLSLEYDFIDQNQLRNGYGPIPPSEVAALNPSAQQEVEHGTINRYLTGGISYAPNRDWNFTALIPYINRTHTTFGAADPTDLETPGSMSGAHSTGLGDIKLLGAWQGLLATKNLGFQLGLKLPTGRYGGENIESGVQVGRAPVYFSSGPAAGTPLDTSLNPGTGSYDLIWGAYYYQPISQDFDAFVNGQFQTTIAHALDQTNADFRPGDSQTFSFGARYEHDPRLIPQLQVNITHKSRDQGALADNTDTAGSVVYLSPGVTGRVTNHLHAYGFIQRPVFSKLDGYQVFPHWTGSLGLSYMF